MTVLDALAVTAAVLAVAAGVGKLIEPRGAVAAMRAAGLSSRDALVRAGSMAEAGAGALVLASSWWLPRILLAAAYAGFAVFSLVAVRSGQPVPCGCFGREGSALGWRHVVLDATFAVALVGSAAPPPPSMLAQLRAGDPAGIASLAVCVVAATLATTLLAATAHRGEAHG